MSTQQITCQHPIKSAPAWFKMPEVQWVCDTCGEEFATDAGA